MPRPSISYWLINQGIHFINILKKIFVFNFFNYLNSSKAGVWTSSSVLKSICRLLCLKVYVVVFKSVILLRTLICDLITNSISIQSNIGNVYSYYVAYDVQFVTYLGILGDIATGACHLCEWKTLLSQGPNQVSNQLESNILRGRLWFFYVN